MGNAISCLTRKNLPQLISLAHLGSALQPSSSTTKDGSSRNSPTLSADNPALNLQTGREKKGGGNKGRSSNSGKNNKLPAIQLPVAADTNKTILLKCLTTYLDNF